MWPFKGKTRQRWSETRRREPVETPTFWRRFRDGGGPGSTLLALGFYLTAVAMDILPIDPMPYHHEGQYVQRDIYARVAFQLLSPEKLAAEEIKIRSSTPAVFRLDSKGLADFISKLQAYPNSFKPAVSPASVPATAPSSGPTTSPAWEAIHEGTRRKKYDKDVQELGKEMAHMPLVDSAQYLVQMSRGNRDVVLIDENGKTTVSKMKLVDVAAAARPLANRFDATIQPKIMELLQARPSYQYDEAASVQAVTDALAALKAKPPSLVYNAYAQHDLIVPQGKDLKADQLELLKAEQDAFQDAQKQATPRWWLWPALGRAMTVLIVCMLLAVYVVRYERAIFVDHWMGFAVAATMLAALALARGAMSTLYSEPVSVLAVIMAVTVLTIARNQRFALMISIILSLLVVHQQRGNLGHFIVLLTGSAAAVMQLREIRSRSRLIEIGAVSALAVLVSVCAVAAASALPPGEMIQHALQAAVAALLVGFLVLGSLPLVERFFRVATSMTLLEWCDASKTLLRRLALEAPGTFNHSLQLGSMCESAADAVGARGLLARAGAYYHDVGKIDKPEYFVENQGGMTNPHAKLSPAMSLLIIIGHVKDGLELAREYALPAVLREFIASHHGTTLVQYFYHAATEQRKSDIDRAPDEVEFRYPGPKPHSKEAAILMLADASESSVRAMPEPTPGRIENQVHTMVTHRLMDGQLDECDLTLREVHQIEASLVRSLCGAYHSRIAYPKLASRKTSDARRRNGNGDKPTDQEQGGKRP